MGWQDVMRTAGAKVLDVTAKSLKRASYWASTSGGAGIALSQALDKPFNVSYAGRGRAEGDIDVNATLINSGYSIHFKLPLTANEEADGGYFFNLENFTNPYFVRMLSLGMIGASFTLKAAENMIKKLQQYQLDTQTYPLINGKKIPRPTNKEFFYLIAEPTVETTAEVLWGHMMMTTLINYTPILSSEVTKTIPASGNSYINGTFYKGPIAEGEKPFQIKLDDAAVPVWGDIQALFRITIEGVFHYGYGAAVKLQPSAPALLPAPASIAITTTLALAGDSIHSFFSRKTELERDQRIHLHLKSERQSEEEESLLGLAGSLSSLSN